MYKFIDHGISQPIQFFSSPPFAAQSPDRDIPIRHGYFAKNSVRGRFINHVRCPGDSVGFSTGEPCHHWEALWPLFCCMDLFSKIGCFTKDGRCTASFQKLVGLNNIFLIFALRTKNRPRLVNIVKDTFSMDDRSCGITQHEIAFSTPGRLPKWNIAPRAPSIANLWLLLRWISEPVRKCAQHAEGHMCPNLYWRRVECG